MTTRRQLGIAGGAICLLAVWNAHDLLKAWWHSPFDRFGWAAAAVWLAPLPFLQRPMRPLCFFAGLGCSLLGALAELNTLTYLGLALCGAGFVAGDRRALPWFVAAVSWMPVFGWMSPVGIILTNCFRLALAAAGSVLLLRPAPSHV